jgi:hypothetical protein
MLDKHNSKKCRALEAAIDAFGIPCHIEVNDGELQVTFLGTTLVRREPTPSGIRVSTTIPNWMPID